MPNKSILQQKINNNLGNFYIPKKWKLGKARYYVKQIQGIHNRLTNSLNNLRTIQKTKKQQYYLKRGNIISSDSEKVEI